MDSNSDTISLHSFSAPISIRGETKQTFDTLLKAALENKPKKTKRKKENTSKENLLSDLDTNNYYDNENLIVEDNEKERRNDNYILNKFLQDSSEIKENDELISVDVEKKNITFIKPPIPKPRKKNIIVDNASSPSSGGTFNVTSPKILKNEDNSSNKTYDISPKFLHKNNVVKEIGDVIIHNSPSTQKVIITTEHNNASFIEKADIETLSDEDAEDNKNFDHVINVEEECKSREEENIELKEFKSNTVKYTNEVVKPKPKKRRDNKEKSERIVLNTPSPTPQQKTIYNYNKIIEIVIHKTDRLQLNSLVIHPIVKIHLVDIDTGKYFQKSDKNRSVVFFYENKNYSYISSVMTHGYNLQEKRNLLPCWEETILLNEDYDYFVANGKQIIIFFEILDFVSFSEAHSRQHQQGWHKIAFAFLKPIGKNSSSNLNRKLKLQLYYPREIKDENPQNCYVWNWWKERKLTKYPSALYITIKSVTSPEKVVETFRSKTPIQAEKSGSVNFTNDLLIKNNINEISNSTKIYKHNQLTEKSSSDAEILWSKSTHENCKLPNKCLGKLYSYDEGCFTLKFSWNGLYLACALRSDDLFLIVVYSVKTLEEVHKFPCHQGLIYSISWSKNDTLIVSASADNTVSIWNFTTSTFLQILPHPSFVYSSEISSDNTIITGCYDGTLRIWNNNSKDDKKMKYNLIQELENHSGYITSISVNSKSTLLYSSDSVGVVIEWKKENNEWKLNREMNLLDLKQTIINRILLFPNEKRILIHSRDSTLRIVDLKSFCILHWLLGSLNKRVQIFSTIPPCGNFVISGSENGFVNVWNAKNGEDLATYIPFSAPVTIHCVEFHPLDNIIAISHYEENLPILLYSYDKDVKGNNNEVNLKLNQNSIELQINDNKNSRDIKLKSRLQSKKPLPNDKLFDFKSILEKMDKIITPHVSNNDKANS